MIQGHINANQFFCPRAFDLTMWGEKTDDYSKILTIAIGPCDPNSFSQEEIEEGKSCKNDQTYFDGK